MKKFDYAVFIGRFSPFQKAHQLILENAFEIAEKVIIVIGSCNTSRTIKNPWSVEERHDMIKSVLSPEQIKKIEFIYMEDYLYMDNLWVSTLQTKINNATDYSDNIALTGFESDETSYYLKLFPQFTFYPCKTKYDFHATHVRNLFFTQDAAYKQMVPEQVASYLEKFKDTKYFTYLKQEKQFIDNYKEQWRGAPFPPIFVTVDNVVIKSGHILVVSRKFNPGKGLLALPGGFLNPKEKIQDAALRELKEETGIKINIPDLKKAIVDMKVFDEPNRSERGRTITNAFLINLGTGALPQVKGQDDAEAAQWISFSDFYAASKEFFEDHWHIINFFISKF